MDLKKLEKEIEAKRIEMNMLVKKLGLQSPVVLKKSKELDDLIIQYQTQKRAVQNK